MHVLSFTVFDLLDDLVRRDDRESARSPSRPRRTPARREKYLGAGDGGQRHQPSA
ncbi:MAG: hypothetical protein U0835_10380 [Isosphaeraceae bacterium]